MSSSRAKLTEPLRYDNVGDLKMRLHGSVVRYRGVPVQITSYYEDLNVQLYSPTSEEFNDKRVHSSDVDLDITSIHVGWVNHPQLGPLYMMRAPWRQQKQGLSLRTMTVLVPNQGLMEGQEAMGGGSGVLTMCTALSGSYPTFEHCTKSTKGGAFSPEWALVPSAMGGAARVVYHKSIPTGLYAMKTKTFLFTRGTLSKTRRASLAEFAPTTGGYVVTEQS